MYIRISVGNPESTPKQFGWESNRASHLYKLWPLVNPVFNLENSKDEFFLMGEFIYSYLTKKIHDRIQQEILNASSSRCLTLDQVVIWVTFSMWSDIHFKKLDIYLLCYWTNFNSIINLNNNTLSLTKYLTD